MWQAMTGSRRSSKARSAPRRWITLLTLAGAWTLGRAGAAPADTIIYHDAFSRSGILEGSAPDVTLGAYGGTRGATWTTPGTGYTTDGTHCTLTTTNGGASLPFLPQAGHVYTLSVGEDCTAPSLDFIGLGYSTANGGTNSQGYHYAVNPSAWMLMRGSTSAYENLSCYSGPTSPGCLTNQQVIGTATGLHTIAIVLDTHPARWTATWYIDGQVVRATTAFDSQNPNITTISFGSYVEETTNPPAPGYVDSFTLTVDAIPEPAALSQMALGGLILLLCRRRR